MSYTIFKLQYINNLIPFIEFTLGLENIISLPFLDVLAIRGNKGVIITVYRNLTHSGVYTRINKDSNLPDYLKHGVIRILHTRAQNISSNDKYLKNEINSIVNEFSKNGTENLKTQINKYKEEE